MSYDSGPDTQKHRRTVGKYIDEVIHWMENRKKDHDLVKLCPPEKAIFDEMTPLLKDCTYGSDEYKGYLERMKPALDHHYATSSHHPEYHPNGVYSMSLLDLMEMLCDWKAAGERHADGSMFKSLQHNRQRFDIREDLFRILCETACSQMGWITEKEKIILITEAFRADNP